MADLIRRGRAFHLHPPNLRPHLPLSARCFLHSSSESLLPSRWKTFLHFRGFRSCLSGYRSAGNGGIGDVPAIVLCGGGGGVVWCASPPARRLISVSSMEDFVKTFGPSLERGRKLGIGEEEQHSLFNFETAKASGLETSLQESSQVLATVQKRRLKRIEMARVYDVAALRVPAEECDSIIYRVQGHLLNWPRIKNVARVPGDDIDDNFKDLLWDSREKEISDDSVLNGVYGVEESNEAPSSVRKRIELVDKFGRHGYRHFPALERMSRPKKRRKLPNGQDKPKPTKTNNEDKIYNVEIVEETEEDASESLSELLDGNVGRKRWNGPTRLLLLDQRYAGKPVSELPMTVQILLKQSEASTQKPKAEIVQCKLTLFYDYWQIHEILKELLPDGLPIPTAFETVGHIAHLNLRDEHLPYRHLIGQVVLDKHRPRIQTVVNKLNSINSQYRTMEVEILAGNHSLVTTVIEHGIQFHVNLATAYWNSRLGTERQRLIQSFSHTDIVCDVFAGVGPIAVAAAKKVKRVFANDLNPSALMYLAKNITENKLQAKVEIFNLDGREFIRSILSFDKPVPMTQVVMNLPTDAVEFLEAFIGAFSRDTWEATQPMPFIHVYGFSKAQDPEADFEQRIAFVLKETPEHITMHRVHLVAPGKWMLCATFRLPHRIAF